jgi:hypothetical protein
MPEIITCPDCDRKLRVPDNLLGKKVKCPGCSVMFTAGAGGAPSKVSRPAPPPEERIEEPPEERRRDSVVRRDDYDDRRSRRRDDDYDDRRSRRRDDDYDDDRRFRRDDDYDDYDDYRTESPRDLRDRWGKVRTGINLNVIGTWVWIGGSVFMAFGAILGGLLLGSAFFTVAGGMGGEGPSQGAVRTAAGSAALGGIILIVAVIVFALCSLAEIVLRVTGFGMCMAVPSLRGTSLKPLAITAFAIAATEAVFRLFGCAWGFSIGATASSSAFMPVGVDIIGWIGRVLCLAGFIVFLLFARSVAFQVRDRGLPGALLTVLIVFAAFYVLVWLAFVVLMFGFLGTAFSAATSSSPTSAANKIGTFGVVAMVLGGILYLAYVGLEVWYIFNLLRLREGIQRLMKKIGRD